MKHGMKYLSCFLRLLVLTFLWILLGIGQQNTLSAQNPAPTALSDAELQQLCYKVLMSLDLFACKPASAQVRKEEAEHALSEFPKIQNDTTAFQAIVAHLGLQRTSTLGPDEKLLIYCDYKTLQSIHLSPSGNRFKVTIDGQQPDNSASGMYIDREGNLDYVTVGLSTPVLSPPLRDISQQPNWKPRPEPPINIEPLEHPQIRYRLLDRFGVFLCPDDSGPAHNSLERRQRILETFPEIEKDQSTFRLILQHLKLEGLTEFTNEQKITVYHEYKKLANIRLDLLVRKFEFSLHSSDKGTQKHAMGFTATGLIDSTGEITVLKKQPYSLGCPK